MTKEVPIDEEEKKDYNRERNRVANRVHRAKEGKSFLSARSTAEKGTVCIVALRMFQVYGTLSLL